MQSRSVPTALLVAVSGLGLAAGAIAQEAQQPPLVFGSDHDYPPFEWLDERGRPKGFHVDLMREVAAQMGRELRIELGPWHEIRHRLEVAHTVDVSDMFHSPEREQVLDFAPPHTIVHHQVFVRRGGPELHGLENLAGLRTAVQRGSFAYEHLRAAVPLAEVVPVDSEPDALRAVIDGTADAAIVGQAAGRFVVEREALADLVPSGPPVLPQLYAFVVAAGRDELREQLGVALQQVKRSGAYAEIDRRWFGPPARGLAPAVWIGAGILVLAAGAWGLLSWRLADRRARETSRRTGRVLQAMLDGYILADAAGRIHDVNPSYEATVGRSRTELLQANIREVEASLDSAGVGAKTAAMLAAGGARFRTQHWHRDGRLVDLDVSAVRMDFDGGPYVAAFVRDVSEQVQLQRQLLHAQKLDTIGRLAGGIAHDFNNLLTAILGYADMLAQRAADDETRHDVQEIQSAARRGAHLTRRLLSFARSGGTEPAVVEVRRLLTGLQGILRRLVGGQVRLELQLDASAGRTLIDPHQLELVVMNLIANARDAMPDGGVVTVRTEPLELAEPLTTPHGVVAAGSWIELAVADTGVGFAEDVMARVFEPFFTTKEVGRGTGLGLSMAAAVVQAAGGVITVRSAPGQGARFVAYLPRVDRESDAVVSPEPDEVPQARAGERIVVVESDVRVRAVVAAGLARAGYSVHVTQTPEELQALLDAKVRPDLVLTDAELPGATGSTASGSAPLRVLVSGQVADAAGNSAAEGPTVLPKPFDQERLLRTVRQVLDAPASPGRG